MSIDISEERVERTASVLARTRANCNIDECWPTGSCACEKLVRIVLTADTSAFAAERAFGVREGLGQAREILLDMQCQHAEHSHDPRHATAATDFARAVAAVEGRIARVEKGEG